MNNGAPANHIVPRSVYVGVFAILIALTATTTVVAYVDLGAFGPFAALTIAVVKATLVILFFMHVRYSTRLTKLVVLGGFFWLAILIALTLNDYLTRGWRTYG